MSNVIVTVQRLVGKSKAIAAGLTTFGIAVATAAERAIATGDVDMTQVRITGGGLVAAIIVAGVTYIVHPGRAEVKLPDTNIVTGQTPTSEIDRGARHR